MPGRSEVMKTAGHVPERFSIEQKLIELVIDFETEFRFGALELRTFDFENSLRRINCLLPLLISFIDFIQPIYGPCNFASVLRPRKLRFQIWANWANTLNDWWKFSHLITRRSEFSEESWKAKLYFEIRCFKCKETSQ